MCRKPILAQADASDSSSSGRTRAVNARRQRLVSRSARVSGICAVAAAAQAAAPALLGAWAMLLLMSQDRSAGPNLNHHF